MARRIVPTEINEKRLMEIMAEGGNVQSEKKKENQEVANTSPPEEVVKEQPSAIKETEPIRKRKNNAETYVALFLKTRKRTARKCTYICPEYHENIINLIHATKMEELGISGYIDNVLEEHFKNHQDEMNVLLDKDQHTKQIKV